MRLQAGRSELGTIPHSLVHEAARSVKRTAVLSHVQEAPLPGMDSGFPDRSCTAGGDETTMRAM
eukprot:1232510-Pyramimonas_sp.AAC.1